MLDFRPNPNSLFAILMRRPWWASGLIALMIVALSRLLLAPQWFMVGAFAAIPFIAIAGMAGWRQLRTPGAARVADTAQTLRAMSWPELARTVTEAWQRDGHQVIPLEAGGRQTGADFEVVKAGRRGVISARRWKVARLGVEPLRELQAAREQREVRDCWCLVTGEVSEPARRFAQQHRIELVEGVELARRIGRLNRDVPRTQ